MNSNHQQETAVVREYAVDEYPPPEARHYGFWDLFLTFIGGNANASTWFVGGCIAAMGFTRALGVTLIANPIVYLCMGALGYMGYKIGSTSMGLARVSLGIRGSMVPSVALLFPYLGWCIVNTFIAAISISYILNSVLGLPAYGTDGSTTTMIIAIVVQNLLTAIALVKAGSRSIKIFERVSGIALVILTIFITVAICTTFDIRDIINWKPPADVQMPLGLGIDNLLGYGLAWITCLAEFTRYTKKVSTAVASPVLGATFSMIWFVLVGTLATIAVAVSTGVFDASASDPSTTITALGFGWVAMLVLILTNVTTNAINMFVAVQAIQNLSPRTSTKKISWGVVILLLVLSPVPLFTGSLVDTFQTFLGYLGAIFAPLGTVMMVDYFIMRRGEYDIRFLTQKNGPYWYSGGVNWCGMIPLVAGFILYFVFCNITWMMNTLGAVAYTMIVTAVLYILLSLIAKKTGYYKPLSTFREGEG